MNKIKKKALPKGFRHLLSQREIKRIEAQLGLPFAYISFGNITHAGSFEKDEHQQSAIHPVSISGHKSETEWRFSVHQSGFRDELLPAPLEKETKEKVCITIVEYMQKVISSKETDFISNPQLWIYTWIIDNKLEVRTKEIE